MALAAQAKVLRVLQDGDVTRIGGVKSRRVDVRVIAATNKRLEEEIGGGRFREDLFYRLNVVPLHVPSLRERREDIPLLVQHFMGQFANEGASTRMEIAPTALDRLTSFDWPGNVRELRNTVERLVILSTGPVVTVSDVDRLVGARHLDVVTTGVIQSAGTFEEFKRSAERVFLTAKLREYDWNVAETARALQMPRSNLYKKIERHRLEREAS